jgi:hypothetical protein
MFTHTRIYYFLFEADSGADEFMRKQRPNKGGNNKHGKPHDKGGNNHHGKPHDKGACYKSTFPVPSHSIRVCI